MSKIGGLFFFLLMIIIALGVVSFASEFFLGRPLMEVVSDLWFALFRR
jgi:hypothetical protein